MENKQLSPQSEVAHIVFGNYEDKGKYGIWLLCKGKKYVLYPRQLIKMLLHKSGELTASCKDGEAWNGNTVYYYDVVDEYRWILTDYYQRLDTAATNVQKLTFHCFMMIWTTRKAGITSCDGRRKIV